MKVSNLFQNSKRTIPKVVVIIDKTDFIELFSKVTVAIINTFHRNDCVLSHVSKFTNTNTQWYQDKDARDIKSIILYSTLMDK